METLNFCLAVACGTSEKMVASVWLRNVWIDIHMDGWLNVWLDILMDDECMDECMNRYWCMHRCTDGWMYE